MGPVCCFIGMRGEGSSCAKGACTDLQNGFNMMPVTRGSMPHVIVIFRYGHSLKGLQYGINAVPGVRWAASKNIRMIGGKIRSDGGM